MRWIAENWIAVVALIVAIIGGVPGIFAIYQHYINRPNVVLSFKRIDYGNLTWPHKPTDRIYILLEVDVSNGDTSPIALPPAPFILSVNLDGQWVPFEKEVIPLSGTVLYANSEDKTGANIDHKDLQKYRELNVGRLVGHYDAKFSKEDRYQDSTHFLLFLSSNVSERKLEKAFHEMSLESLPVRISWLNTKAKLHRAFLVAHKKPRITRNCYKVFPDRVKFYEFSSD